MSALLTKEQLAEHLGVHTSTIERWRHEGRIPFYRVGYRYIRYDLDEVRSAIIVHEAVQA